MSPARAAWTSEFLLGTHFDIVGSQQGTQARPRQGCEGVTRLNALSARGLAQFLGEPATGGPLYIWLATGIGTLIGDGRVPVGIRLPAERELGAALGLSRTTVTAAYRTLRAEGWSTSRLGAGSWTRLPAGGLVVWCKLPGPYSTALTAAACAVLIFAAWQPGLPASLLSRSGRTRAG